MDRVRIDELVAFFQRCAAAPGADRGALPPAAEASLLEVGARVRSRIRWVRSAAHRSASLQHRHEVHRALAEVTDPKPDRRAWHWPHATPGPDEDVAAELQRSAAGRAAQRADS